MRKQQYAVNSRSLRKSNEREEVFFDTEAEARQYALARVKMLQDALHQEFPEEYPNRWLDSTDIRFCAVTIAPYPEKPQKMYVVEARLFNSTDYAVAGVYTTEWEAREAATYLVENLRRITGLEFPESVHNRWQDSVYPLYSAVTITNYGLNSDQHLSRFVERWESKGKRK